MLAVDVVEDVEDAAVDAVEDAVDVVVEVETLEGEDPQGYSIP